MVAVAPIKADGTLYRKQSYSRHALAAVGFQKTDVDFIAICKARHDAMSGGSVVGIGYGSVIRRRPKIAGPSW